MVAPRMLHSSRLIRIVKYVAAVLVLLGLVLPYLRKHSSRVRGQYDEILRSFQDEKKLFVADLLENEVGGDFDGAALASLCASRAWYPDDRAVILTCEPVPGGLGGVKNGQLSCIRFAIEIGAQLVLPRMHTRSTVDISNLHGGQQSKGLGIDYMFSQSHLVESLQRHCPQLKIHASLDTLYDKPSLLKPLQVSIPQLVMTLGDMASFIDATTTPILREPARLRGQFERYMDTELPVPTRRYPVRVHLANTMFAWPTVDDGEPFRRNFGKLLRVRDDVKVLAASALWNIAKRFDGVPLPNPRHGHTDSGTGAADLSTSDGFLAIHLRTEKDAAQSQFPGYDDQTRYFFHFLASLPPPPPPPPSSPAMGDSGRRIVFLATGLTAADEDVKRFRARAAELNTTVVLKRDLLDATEVGVLNQLTWDQRALVDYEILLRAGKVLGTVESSFAWNIALRRGEAYGDGVGFEAEPGGLDWIQGVFDRDSLKMWADSYTRLYGRAQRAVSIYLGTWP